MRRRGVGRRHPAEATGADRSGPLDLANPTPPPTFGEEFPDSPDEPVAQRPPDQPDLDAFARRMGTDTLEVRAGAGSIDRPTLADRVRNWREPASGVIGGMSRGAKAAASRLGSLAERLVQGSGEPLGLAGLRERVAGVSTVMVTTIDEQGTLSSRPITVQEIDDSGDVWFVVDRHADWVHDGVDAERLRRLWNPVLDAWFPDGPPTDGVVVMHVQADRWEYWTAPSDPPGRPSAGSRARAPSYDADESGRAAMPGEGGEWMAGLCEGRVAIVTGAGRGIGREHALSLARQGAKVVDDPTAIGSVVEQLLADARPNSGMSGVPGAWPQTMLQS